MGLDYGASSDLIAEDNKRTLAELEAIVYGNLINGDASMGLDYGASSDLIAEDNKRRLEALELAVTIQPTETPPPTDILFGNSAITSADGTRSVVSEGTDTTAKLDLYSGQGLRFDGTQHIDTEFIPSLDKDFTVLWVQDRIDLAEGDQNGTYTVDKRFHFGFWQDGVRCGIGDNASTVPDNRLGTFDLFARYNANSGVVDFGFIGGATTTFITSPVTGILSLYIGAVNGFANTTTARQKDFYFIPKELTDTELAAHLQNPEQTLYYDNEVLKSGFLSQQVIDDMQAGNGFWYPLCENNNAARGGTGAVRNLITPNDPVVIVSSTFDSLGDDTFSTQGGGKKEVLLNVPTGYDYLIDIEFLESNGQDMGFWSGTSTASAFNITTQLGKREIFFSTLSNSKSFYRDDFGRGFIGKIKLSNLRQLKRIINYSNSPMRDNADRLTYGMQTSLIKQDGAGVPVGLADNSELVWVDDSYATPDVPLVLTGNFCVDTYVKEIGTADSTFLNFTTDTVDPILIGVAGATGNVDIALLTEYTSTEIGASGAVVSLERDGGTLKAFVNNIEVSRVSYSGTVTLDIVGASTTTSNFATGESGSLGFTKTTRTYGQRLSTYNALRAKHGV